MNNFDLKKFLIENKLTSNSRLMEYMIHHSTDNSLQVLYSMNLDREESSNPYLEPHEEAEDDFGAVVDAIDALLEPFNPVSDHDHYSDDELVEAVWLIDLEVKTVEEIEDILKSVDLKGGELSVSDISDLRF